MPVKSDIQTEGFLSMRLPWQFKTLFLYLTGYIERNTKTIHIYAKNRFVVLDLQKFLSDPEYRTDLFMNKNLEFRTWRSRYLLRNKHCVSQPEKPFLLMLKTFILSWKQTLCL